MRSVLPIPLKNLNYLQAKAGGAETHKFPPIPQIGGLRSKTLKVTSAQVVKTSSPPTLHSHDSF